MRHVLLQADFLLVLAVVVFLPRRLHVLSEETIVRERVVWMPQSSSLVRWPSRRSLLVSISQSVPRVNAFVACSLPDIVGMNSTRFMSYYGLRVGLMECRHLLAYDCRLIGMLLGCRSFNSLFFD